jgi:hypothetical protein
VEADGRKHGLENKAGFEEDFKSNTPPVFGEGKSQTHAIKTLKKWKM